MSPHRYSELANWDGSHSKSPSNPPSGSLTSPSSKRGQTEKGNSPKSKPVTPVSSKPALSQNSNLSSLFSSSTSHHHLQPSTSANPTFSPPTSGSDETHDEEVRKLLVPSSPSGTAFSSSSPLKAERGQMSHITSTEKVTIMAVGSSETMQASIAPRRKAPSSHTNPPKTQCLFSDSSQTHNDEASSSYPIQYNTAMHLPPSSLPSSPAVEANLTYPDSSDSSVATPHDLALPDAHIVTENGVQSNNTPQESIVDQSSAFLLAAIIEGLMSAESGSGVQGPSEETSFQTAGPEPTVKKADQTTSTLGEAAVEIQSSSSSTESLPALTELAKGTSGTESPFATGPSCSIPKPTATDTIDAESISPVMGEIRVAHSTTSADCKSAAEEDDNTGVSTLAVHGSAITGDSAGDSTLANSEENLEVKHSNSISSEVYSQLQTPTHLDPAPIVSASAHIPLFLPDEDAQGEDANWDHIIPTIAARPSSPVQSGPDPSSLDSADEIVEIPSWAPIQMRKRPVSPSVPGPSRLVEGLDDFSPLSSLSSSSPFRQGIVLHHQHHDQGRPNKRPKISPPSHKPFVLIPPPPPNFQRDDYAPLQPRHSRPRFISEKKTHSGYDSSTPLSSISRLSRRPSPQPNPKRPRISTSSGPPPRPSKKQRFSTGTAKRTSKLRLNTTGEEGIDPFKDSSSSSYQVEIEEFGDIPVVSDGVFRYVLRGLYARFSHPPIEPSTSPGKTPLSMSKRTGLILHPLRPSGSYLSSSRPLTQAQLSSRQLQKQPAKSYKSPNRSSQSVTQKSTSRSQPKPPLHRPHSSSTSQRSQHQHRKQRSPEKQAAPTPFILTAEYMTTQQQYVSPPPSSDYTPGITPDSLNPSASADSSISRSPDIEGHQPRIDTTLTGVSSTFNIRNLDPRLRGTGDVVLGIPQDDSDSGIGSMVYPLPGSQSDKAQDTFDRDYEPIPIAMNGSINEMYSQAYQQYTVSTWMTQPRAHSYTDPSSEPSSSSAIPPAGISPVGMNDNLFGNGTIDPSLLGGASSPMKPSPTPPPSSLPSTSPARRTQASSPTRARPAHSSPSARRAMSDSYEIPENIPLEYDYPDDGEYKPGGAAGKSTSKGKGKGKGKSKETSLRAMEKNQELMAAAGKTSSERPQVEGKRERRPSTRVREALASVDIVMSDADADGSTVDEDEEETEEAGVKVLVRVNNTERSGRKSKPKPQHSVIADSDLEDAAPTTTKKKKKKDELTACHHCRRKTLLQKMRCTNQKADGQRCILRFCINCVIKRYPDIEFDPHARPFTCPRCSDTCNCTVCSRRRGEEYVPAPRGRIASLTDVTRQRHSSSVTATTSDVSVEPMPMTWSARDSLPPQATFWGAVYGVSGERLGTAFKDDDNKRIVVAGTPSKIFPMKSHIQARRRDYVGSLRDRWRSCSKAAPSIAGPDPNAPLGKEKELPVPSQLTERMYIGQKALLSSQDYNPFATYILDDGSERGAISDRGSSPLTPLSERGSDPLALPSKIDLGFVVAQALQIASESDK